MPKKKEQPTPSRRSFLPDRGEGSDDAGADYIINGICLLLEVVWALALCVLIPVAILVCYITHDAWVTPHPNSLQEKEKKNRGNKIKIGP